MTRYYTFSTIAKDGKKYYPEQIKEDQSGLVSTWTTDIEKAVMWGEIEHFDYLMNEYENTRIEEIKNNDDQPLICVTNANDKQKFVSFKIKDVEDGITVGLYPNGDGLVINYRGDQVNIPFNADSAVISELNNRSFPSSKDME